MNKIAEILAEAGYDVKGLDNRNRAIKSINSVFANTAITMRLCAKGKVWVAPNGYEYNAKVTLEGVGMIKYKTDCTPYALLKTLGKFLRNSEVKEKIHSDVSLRHTCPKCEGAGIIPAFMYYADGICFDCNGCGMVGDTQIENIALRSEREKQGLPYLNKFYVVGNYAEIFPQGVENLQAVSHYNHPTAIVYIGVKDDNYYIHAPICQLNSWHKIPFADFEKFKAEWNKYHRGNQISINHL